MTTTGAALIAGAGPGVSGSLARLLAGDGHAVGLLGVDQGALDDLVGSVISAGGEAVGRTVDLTDDAAARAAVDDLADALGPFAVVHVNPSVFREKDPLELSVDELLDDVRLGVGSLLTVVQAARPHLRDGARVSVTGSMAADQPWHRAASLGVQKAGVRNLVLSLDETLREHGVRACSVTVRGTLSDEGPFTPDRVAAAIGRAIARPDERWTPEVPYSG